MLQLGERIVIVDDRFEQNLPVGEYGYIIAYDRNNDSAFDYIIRVPKANRQFYVPGSDIELERTLLELEADRIEKETGKVIARAEVPFQQTGDVATLMDVGTAGGGSAGIASSGSADLQKVVIKRGDNLWTISRKLYGKGVRFSTIYEANNDQIRNPDLIYPGQVFLLPAGDTRWKE